MVQNNNQVPAHVGIIMDGNGRWAKKRLLPRVAGHKKGVETIKKIAIHANQLGIKLITLYAFSTENWGRPDEEVKFLMKLPKEFFASFLPELIQNNCRVDYIGDMTRLPEETQSILMEAIEQSKSCTGLVLNFAINYGSQQEITEAIKKIGSELIEGSLTLDHITPSLVDQYLMTAQYGDLAKPDLIIRTSGEQRLSNFLLWQSAYSELYFTSVYWPDFSTHDFDLALETYASRQRRYGKV